MKRGIFSSLTFLFALLMLATACTTETVTIDSALPNGTLEVARAGSLTAENGTPTTGTIELGTDEDNVNFLRFGSDFTTELATGTVSVYFSTSETFTADPMNGNPDLILVGAVQGNGEQFFRLKEPVPGNFTHVILWCNTASIPFGNGALN